jgi:hypothetical protein
MKFVVKKGVVVADGKEYREGDTIELDAKRGEALVALGTVAKVAGAPKKAKKKADKEADKEAKEEAEE